MDRVQLQAYCAALPGAESTLHAEPANILVYAVGGKRFAHFKTSEPERWRFTFKAPPGRFLELTDMPGVKPARWLARYHWVTIVDVRAFPEDELRALVRWGHQRALSALGKRQRAALTGAE